LLQMVSFQAINSPKYPIILHGITPCLKIKLFFRYINTTSRVWCKAGHFNKALSKGPKTTTWIWNLHSDGHDFPHQQSWCKCCFGLVECIFMVHIFLIIIFG
jgi:hypothetical protein